LFRPVIALVLLAILILVFVSLGRWQWRRAEERRLVSTAIEAGRRQPSLTLTATTVPGELQSWRLAAMQGRWRNDLTVLLDNRHQHGRPGYWVATPLILHGDSGIGVLVLRGWLPHAGSGRGAPIVPAAAAGVMRIEGELRVRVPRLFELWHVERGHLDPASRSTLPTKLPVSGELPIVQNLDLDVYAKASGLTLLPVVVAQLIPNTDGLGRDWPQPAVDANQNMGYALQWFAFAAIAAGAFLVTAGRIVCRRRYRELKVQSTT
jgi:cytochrome oxidase assembly protein ShyY1